MRVHPDQVPEDDVHRPRPEDSDFEGSELSSSISDGDGDDEGDDEDDENERLQAQPKYYQIPQSITCKQKIHGET